MAQQNTTYHPNWPLEKRKEKKEKKPPPPVSMAAILIANGQDMGASKNSPWAATLYPLEPVQANHRPMRGKHDRV